MGQQTDIERNLEIQNLYVDRNLGVTIKQLARWYGLSESRICGIVDKPIPDNAMRKYPDRFKIRVGKRTITLCGRY